MQLISNIRVQNGFILHFLFLLEPDEIGILVEDLKETVAVVDLTLDLVARHEAK